MSLFRISTLVLGCLLLLEIGLRTVDADEIVVNTQISEEIDVGDFQLRPCPIHVAHSLGIAGVGSDGQITAGELWQFFDKNGITSLDRITLCLDVDQMDGDSGINLHAIEFRIEDPSGSGLALTDVNLGDNSLLVPACETSAFKPEAKLEFELGYDFMQRFNASSPEKIQLRFASSNLDASRAKFFIEAESNTFSWFNYLLMACFVLFWMGVFGVLYHFTKPSPDSNSDTTDSDSPDTGSSSVYPVSGSVGSSHRKSSPI